MRNWQNFLLELSRKMDLPAGVRHIYTPENGHRIKSLSQLYHKRTFVCGSLEPFKKIDYRNVKNPVLKVSRPRVSETVFSNLQLSPPEPHPIFTRSFKNLDARERRRWMVASNDGDMKRSRRHSKIRHQVSRAEPEMTIKSPKHLSHSLQSLHDTTANPKYLALSIYRNGLHENREFVTVYMNRNTIKSWEEALQLISENLRVINGCLHLYKLDGGKVESLSQLWTAGTNLIETEKEEFHLFDFLMGSRGKHVQVNCIFVITWEKMPQGWNYAQVSELNINCKF